MEVSQGGEMRIGLLVLLSILVTSCASKQATPEKPSSEKTVVSVFDQEAKVKSL